MASAPDLTRGYDVLVVGGGNAGLCAAIEARRAGASVLLLECAPRALRGGNSRHTRNLRYVHREGDDCLTGPYLAEELWDDLIRVTGGHTDERLARLLIRESEGVGRWMRGNGVRFQPALAGTLSLARTNAFFLGGGKALVNTYYALAERLGVAVSYESEALAIHFREGRFDSLTVARDGREHPLRARALVVAAGGFEANLEWLAQIWGERARGFLVRGSPFNRGRMLRALLDHGARPVSEPDQCHAVAIDARAPRFDGGIISRVDCVGFGIVVNRAGRRFYDEGEDFWPRRYAIWGRLIADQPDQIAYVIIDAKSEELFMPTVFPPFRAETPAALAGELGIEPQSLERTIAEFNAAVRPGRFDPEVLDECATRGLEPPKSHWARPLDTPPLLAWPLRPGITFTYLGVAVDERARVLGEDGAPLPDCYAAGEVMAGNILGRGYVGGIGLTIGTVFGRIAGREAAARARR